MDDAADHSLPLHSQTTTTDDDSAWSAVVVEVESCGVSQAAKAVAIARQRGASIDEVRAIVAEWRSRRDGWQHREAILYRRLRGFDRQQPPADGWPAFDEAHLARLDRERRDRDRAAALKQQHARRREFLAGRDQAHRERQDQGITLAGLAAEIDPALAAGIRRAAERQARASAPHGDAHHPRPPPSA